MAAAAGVAFAAAAIAAPKQQQAIVQAGVGGPEVLQYRNIPVLDPGRGQVLIRVYAASVEPGDWKMRMGTLFPGAGDGAVPGGDAAGVIEKLGPGVTRFRRDEPVLALVEPGVQLVAPTQDDSKPLNGGYSHYVVVPESAVAPKPARISYAEATGLPRAGAMAMRLISHAGVTHGQRVLIIGAAGGIGHLAVQIAKSLDAQVIAVASPRHDSFLRSLNVDELVDYTHGDWAASLQGVDVVIDLVGGSSGSAALGTVKRGGIFIQPSVLPTPNLTTERCAAAGIRCTIAPFSSGTEYLPQLVALAEAGKLKVRVSRTYPLPEAGKAQEDNRAGHAQGKIILIVDETMANKKK